MRMFDVYRKIALVSQQLFTKAGWDDVFEANSGPVKITFVRHHDGVTFNLHVDAPLAVQAEILAHNWAALALSLDRLLADLPDERDVEVPLHIAAQYV